VALLPWCVPSTSAPAPAAPSSCSSCSSSSPGGLVVLSPHGQAQGRRHRHAGAAECMTRILVHHQTVTKKTATREGGSIGVERGGAHGHEGGSIGMKGVHGHEGGVHGREGGERLSGGPPTVGCPLRCTEGAAQRLNREPLTSSAPSASTDGTKSFHVRILCRCLCSVTPCLLLVFLPFFLLLSSSLPSSSSSLSSPSHESPAFHSLARLCTAEKGNNRKKRWESEMEGCGLQPPHKHCNELAHLRAMELPVV